MRDLARHLVRAGSVPKHSSKLTDQTSNTQRLDSWRVEEVRPSVAASDIGDVPSPEGKKMGRPVHAVEDRRSVRFVTYLTESEEKLITRYQKKRRLSRSDAVRELILLGIAVLKSEPPNEKTPPRGGVTRP